MKQPNKMRKIGLGIILSLLYPICAYAQLPSVPKSALTPNAASLGIYGDVPVSIFTGTPEISIPLYNIDMQDFSLPISLSYYAGGVRPDQRAGWTGLGWTLNAGGVITRSVNDREDEFDNPLSFADGAKSGYYYNHNVLNTPSWNLRSYLRSIAQEYESQVKDTAPDEFSFSFDGYSGKFYLDHNGNWVVQCDKPVKVEFNGVFLSPPFNKSGTIAQKDGCSPCFNGFTIVAEDGTRYVFGGDDRAIDFSIDFFAQSIRCWVATAWYLTKVITPAGQEINFKYERGEFNNQMYIAMREDIGSYTESTGGAFSAKPKCSSNNTTSLYSSYNGNLLSPVYLTEIVTDNSVLSFCKSISNELKYDLEVYEYQASSYYNASNNQYPFLPFLNSQNTRYPACLDYLKWYKLDSITIKDKTQTKTIKTINLNYNNDPTQRLILNNVVESGKRPYVFSYNNAGGLPPYLSNKTDHWGFYNNTYASLVLDEDIPWFVNLNKYQIYYNFRNPNPNYLQYGILEKITYPTGGYTEFEFEPHSYRKQLSLNRSESCNTLSLNQLAGGLRIKRIKNSSTPEGPSEVSKEYYYVTDYLQNNFNSSISSGVLGGQVRYYFDDYVVYAFNDNDTKRLMKAFSTISVLPSCHNTLGSHVGYSEVIERRPDNSFTRYQFSNFDNGHMDEPADAIIQLSRTPYEPYASKSMERGKLIVQEDYTSNNIKVRSKTISYEKDTPTDNYVRAVVNARNQQICPESGDSYDEGTSYKIYTYTLRPRTNVENLYNPDDGHALGTTYTEYTYTDKKLLRSVSLENSAWRTHKTEYKYPFDFLENPVLSQMNDSNMVSPIVEQTEYKDKQLVKKTIVEYKDWGNSLIKPLSVKIQSSSLGQLENRIAFNSYDLRGNPLHVSKDDAKNIIYLWSYNYQYMVAEIQMGGYTFAEVESAVKSLFSVASLDHLSKMSIPNEVKLTDGSLQRALPYALVTTYTYRPLVGMLTATAPNSVTTYYDYDAFSRLKRTYIKENNVEKTVQSYDYHYKQ